MFGVDFAAGGGGADAPQYSNFFDHLTSNWDGPTGAGELLPDGSCRGTDGPDDPRGNIDMTTAFGQWVHIAAVYDMEAGQRTVYVNGSVDVSIDDGGTVAAATQNTYIGARSNSGNTGPEAFFSGSLDEVCVYGRALSLEELAALAGRTQPFDRPQRTLKLIIDSPWA